MNSTLKDSGVAWMGPIPSHWSVRRVKHVANLVNDRQSSSSGAPYVGLEHIESQTGRFVAGTDGLQTDAESTVGVFVRDDVLFGKLRPYLAKAVVANSPGVCSSEILVFRPVKIVAGYLKLLMLLDGFIQTVSSATYGTKMPRAEPDSVRRMFMPIPPRDEQLSIVNYLNTETARIDALIESKTQLLSALIELRESRTTEILTGRDLSLTSTGDTWIPSLPVSWSLKRLKHLGQVHSGIAKGKKYASADLVELPYLRVANVQDGRLDLSEITTIEVLADEVDRYSLERGDVLMNEGGDYDKVGRGAVWQGEIEPCLHQNHVFAVRMDDPEMAEWVSAITRTAYAKFYFMNNAKQSTNLASISQKNIKEFPVVMPPREERVRRLAQLNQELAKITELETHVKAEIEALSELRSATITDAVLGRIDLTEFQSDTHVEEAA